MDGDGDGICGLWVNSKTKVSRYGVDRTCPVCK